MSSAIYRGFSTSHYLTNKKKGFTLVNEELIKQDLLNYIYTIPGERVHMPTFGTRIPLLAFEPADEKTLAIVREDLTKAVAADPRLELVDMAVMAAPSNNAIIAYLDLKYVELSTSETVQLEFNTKS